MISTLAGAAVNLMLDPVFIFGFHWGMMGAAVATVHRPGRSPQCLAIWYLCHMKSVSSSAGKASALHGRCCQAISAPGHVQLSFADFAGGGHGGHQQHGAQIRRPGRGFRHRRSTPRFPWPCVGIVMKFFQIIISIVVGHGRRLHSHRGLQHGRGPQGSGRRPCSPGCLSPKRRWAAVTLVVVELLPQAADRASSARPNESVHYTDFAVRAFRVYLCMLPLACVNKATFIYLQALGKAAGPPRCFPWCAKCVFGVGLALLLPVFFGLDGVLVFHARRGRAHLRRLSGGNLPDLSGTDFCQNPLIHPARPLLFGKSRAFALYIAFQQIFQCLPSHRQPIRAVLHQHHRQPGHPDRNWRPLRNYTLRCRPRR